MKKSIFIFAALSLLCGGCTNQQRLEDYNSYIKYYKVSPPSDLTTQTCRGYGCRIIDTVTLKPREWRYITEPLARKPKSAADERERLRWVMGRFESVVGAMTGTHADVPGTYLKLGDEQQDCADESVNTTLYLLMLENHKLLRFHTTGRPGGRFPPHLTGVVIENGTGTAYAVDTWFHFNGVRAEVLPLDEWKYGWHPEHEDLKLQDIQAPRTW